MGITFTEVFSRANKPFGHISTNADVIILPFAEVRAAPRAPTKCLPSCSEFVQLCWNADPKSRPAVEWVVSEMEDKLELHPDLSSDESCEPRNSNGDPDYQEVSAEKRRKAQ